MKISIPYRNIPVFNFPGWMLIMFYGTICLLVGRWWYRKSGYRTWVGITYPFIVMIAALLLMISPLSRLLLWLGPFFQKGDPSEWFLLAFHLAVPTALLVFLWRGRWIVLLASAVQTAFLLFTYLKNHKDWQIIHAIDQEI